MFEEDSEDFISVKQVAKLICSTPNSVYVMMHRGVFPHDMYYKVGKRKIVFSRAKLLSWIMKKKE